MAQTGLEGIVQGNVLLVNVDLEPNGVWSALGFLVVSELLSQFITEVKLVLLGLSQRVGRRHIPSWVCDDVEGVVVVIARHGSTISPLDLSILISLHPVLHGA